MNHVPLRLLLGIMRPDRRHARVRYRQRHLLLHLRQWTNPAALHVVLRIDPRCLLADDAGHGDAVG